MRWITWWLRIVGALYLLLTGLNLVFLATNPSFFAETIPYDVDELGVRAFMDAWLVFVLELGALGGVMVAASFTPASGNRTLVWAILAAELLRGVVADVVWLTRGYDPAVYGPFIVLHLVVIATGAIALRRASATA